MVEGRLDGFNRKKSATHSDQRQSLWPVQVFFSALFFGLHALSLGYVPHKSNARNEYRRTRRRRSNRCVAHPKVDERIGIGFISHTGLMSGAETSLLLLIEHLDRQHFKPVLIAPTAGPLLSQALRYCRVVGVSEQTDLIGKPTRGHSIRFVRETWQVARQIARVVRQQHLHILHANSLRAGIIAGIVRCMVPNVRVIVHVRDTMDYKRPLHLGTALVTALIADRIISISGFVARCYDAQRLIHTLTAKKTVTIYNGVDTQHFNRRFAANSSIRAQLSIPFDAWPLIGVVGQITPWKRQDAALRAFALLMAEGHFPQARLLIVGDAKFTNAQARYHTREYKAMLQQFVREHGLSERVIFTGDRPDVSDILANLDLSLLLSANEPFGRVVIESMAAETPVIAAREGGIPEIIEDGVTGWLADSIDAPHIVALIEAALANPAKRQKVCEAGVARVRQTFTIENHVAAIEQIYTDIYRASTRPSLRHRLLQRIWAK